MNQSARCKAPIRTVQTLDLEWLAGQTQVIDLDPLAVSCRLSHRPTTVHGKSLWPDLVMLEAADLITIGTHDEVY